MHIGVITLFPRLFQIFSEEGTVVARALKKGALQLSIWNPRTFSEDKHRRVDDRPYGGGPGMVMQIQPIRAAIIAARAVLGESTPVVYLSPQGRRLDHNSAQELLQQPQLLLLAGHYEGIDERLLKRDIQQQWSIGDYVLSGGELAAMVMIDVLTRWLPGALGDEQSAQQDSFSNGLLDHPQYTRPVELDGQKVPPVLLSGNHAAIARWRQRQALGCTWLRRPELLNKLCLTPEQQQLLQEFIDEYQQGEST